MEGMTSETGFRDTWKASRGTGWKSKRIQGRQCLEKRETESKGHYLKEQEQGPARVWKVKWAKGYFSKELSMSGGGVPIWELDQQWSAHWGKQGI